MKGDRTLQLINTIGAVLCFSYMLVYFLYTLNKVRRRESCHAQVKRGVSKCSGRTYLKGGLRAWPCACLVFTFCGQRHVFPDSLLSQCSDDNELKLVYLFLLQGPLYRQVLGVACVLFPVLVYVQYYTHSHMEAVTVMGTVCAVGGICSFASPLSALVGSSTTAESVPISVLAHLTVACIGKQRCFLFFSTFGCRILSTKHPFSDARDQKQVDRVHVVPTDSGQLRRGVRVGRIRVPPARYVHRGEYTESSLPHRARSELSHCVLCLQSEKINFGTSLEQGKANVMMRPTNENI